MEFIEYRDIVRHTFLEEYPVYFFDMFIKELEKDNIIYNDKRKSYNEALLNISMINNAKDKLKYLFENVNNIIKKCEEFEYQRAYRYSYLYKIENFNKGIIETLKHQEKIVEFSDDSLYDDMIQNVINRPTIKEDNNINIFKFSLKLTSNIEDDSPIKHTILAIVDENLSTLEIRQDIVPVKYQNKEDFYTDIAKRVKTWIKSCVECDIQPIDFQGTIRYMKANKQNEIKIAALRLEKDGMLAELDSAKNPNLDLPILDELREMISLEIFDKDENTKSIKTMLADFIKDIEDNSLMSSAKVIWKKEGYELISYHEKTENEECYFKWRKSLKDREAMDYVTRYSMQCENEFIESINN